jgi:hypothetical protein
VAGGCADGYWGGALVSEDTRAGASREGLAQAIRRELENHFRRVTLGKKAHAHKVVVWDAHKKHQSHVNSVARSWAGRNFYSTCYGTYIVVVVGESSPPEESDAAEC